LKSEIVHPKSEIVHPKFEIPLHETQTSTQKDTAW
jgi:hypothetical protein